MIAQLITLHKRCFILSSKKHVGMHLYWTQKYDMATLANHKSGGCMLIVKFLKPSQANLYHLLKLTSGYPFYLYCCLPSRREIFSFPFICISAQIKA